MSEDTNTDSGQQQESTENNLPEYSKVEQHALEKGWKPKEEFNGDPNQWRSAEVFLALEEPIKRIEQQSRDLKNVKKVLDDFKSHHAQVKQAEFDRALKFLQGQRKEAIVNGEHDKVFEIEDQIDSVKAGKEQVVQETRTTTEPVGDPAAFQSWVASNKWYTDNAEMRKKADKLGFGYHASGDSPDEVLRQVGSDIRRLFPEEFKSAASKRAAAVEAPTRSGRASSNGNDELDATERAVMKRYVEQGVMTEAQYKADLKTLKSRG